MDKKPVVIDCAPGVDDAFAILLAACRPELDIRAICAVAGNVSLSQALNNTLRLKGRLGLACRAARGAEQPLIAPRCDAGGGQGENGLGGAALPPSGAAADADYAWDVLMQEAGRAGGQLEVVALGPLTNLAIALMRHPALAGGIKKITIVGGTAHTGNVGPYSEFNIWADPHACDVVLQSGVPIALCGLDGCAGCGLTDDELRALAGRGGRIGELCAPMAGHAIRQNGPHDNVLPGLVAMACFVQPGMAQYKPCFVECETQSTLAAGQTVVDLYHLSGRQPNADFLLGADKRAYMALLGAMMDHYETMAW